MVGVVNAVEDCISEGCVETGLNAVSTVSAFVAAGCAALLIAPCVAAASQVGVASSTTSTVISVAKATRSITKNLFEKLPQRQKGFTKNTKIRSSSAFLSLLSLLRAFVFLLFKQTLRHQERMKLLWML
jgi:hypothetical protein